MGKRASCTYTARNYPYRATSSKVLVQYPAASGTVSRTAPAGAGCANNITLVAVVCQRARSLKWNTSQCQGDRRIPGQDHQYKRSTPSHLQECVRSASEKNQLVTVNDPGPQIINRFSGAINTAAFQAKGLHSYTQGMLNIRLQELFQESSDLLIQCLKYPIAQATSSVQSHGIVARSLMGWQDTMGSQLPPNSTRQTVVKPVGGLVRFGF